MLALRRTVVISDVHLATVDRSVGRSAGRSDDLDACLAMAIDASVLRAARDRAALEIVLAGDVLDVDAPAREGEPDLLERRRARGAAWMVGRILADHPLVVLALRRALVACATVVVLPGNHDSQIAFPSVQAVFSRSLLGGPSFSPSYLSGPVLVEHGHQYDPMCRMASLLPDANGQLDLTVGAIATHHADLLPGADPSAVDPLRTLSSAPMTAILNRLRDPSAAVRLMTAIGSLAHVSPDPLANPLANRELGTESCKLLLAPKADAELLRLAAVGAYDYGADVDARLRTAMRGAAAGYGVRAIVMGHTHEPFVEEDGGVFYCNSGCWRSPLVGSSADPHVRSRSGGPADRRTGGPADLVGTFVEIDHVGSRVRSASLKRVRADGTIA